MCHVSNEKLNYSRLFISLELIPASKIDRGNFGERYYRESARVCVCEKPFIGTGNILLLCPSLLIKLSRSPLQREFCTDASDYRKDATLSYLCIVN